MIHCKISYGPDKISVDFYPGTANFDYWLNKKVVAERWKPSGDGIWLTCEDITEDEADYIERIAIAQWGPERCEIRGKDVPEQAGQLSLF